MANELDLYSGSKKSSAIVKAEKKAKNNMEVFKGTSKKGEVTVVAASSMDLDIAEGTKEKIETKRDIESIEGITYDSMKGSIKSLDKTIDKLRNRNIILANDVTDDYEMYIEFRRTLNYIIGNVDFFKKVNNRFKLINIMDKSKYLDLSIPFIDGVGMTNYSNDLVYSEIQEDDIIGIHHVNVKNKFDPKKRGMGTTNLRPLKNKYTRDEALYLGQKILQRVPVATVDSFKKTKMATYSLMYDDVVTIVCTDNDLIFLDNYPYKLKEYLEKMKEIFELKVTLADIVKNDKDEFVDRTELIGDGTPDMVFEGEEFGGNIESLSEIYEGYIEIEKEAFAKIQQEFAEHIISQKVLLFVSGIPSTVYSMCDADVKGKQYLYNHFMSNRNPVGDYMKFWRNFKDYPPVVKCRNEYLSYLMDIASKKLESKTINKMEYSRYEVLFRRASLIVLYYNIYRTIRMMDSITDVESIKDDLPY